MQEQDYDASVLFGIANFYHRVGFATCFPEHGVAIDTREAERVQTSLRGFGRYTNGRISSARHPSCVPGAGMGFPWGPVLASPLPPVSSMRRAPRNVCWDTCSARRAMIVVVSPKRVVQEITSMPQSSGSWVARRCSCDGNGSRPVSRRITPCIVLLAPRLSARDAIPEQLRADRAHHRPDTSDR